MSGVYIYEVSPRDNSGNIIKIGCSRKHIAKRAEDSFRCDFNSDFYGFFLLHEIPCNYSLAVNMENYFINNLIENYPHIKRKGREFFYCSSEDIKEFLDDVDKQVISFFRDVANLHTSMESSVGCLIRSKRKINKISQTELAFISGLRQATISEMENGKIGNYTTLKKVCDSLDINILFS